jgi:hypothetical protein
VSDHPGLDLVNTAMVGIRGQRLDLVPDWRGLLDWAEAAGLIDSDVARRCRSSSNRRGRSVHAWFRRLR